MFYLDVVRQQQANEEAGQAEIERVLPGREYMYKTTSMISLDDLVRVRCRQCVCVFG